MRRIHRARWECVERLAELLRAERGAEAATRWLAAARPTLLPTVFAEDDVDRLVAQARTQTRTQAPTEPSSRDGLAALEEMYAQYLVVREGRRVELALALMEGWTLSEGITSWPDQVVRRATNAREKVEADEASMVQSMEAIIRATAPPPTATPSG